METKDTLSSCSNSEEQQMQQIQDKANESCMVSFWRIHSHLKLFLNNELKGTQTECGFKRAFVTLFGQDVETFTGTMFLNMDQLEKQIDKEEFQEIGFMAAFKVLETQFQLFIKSRIYLDDEYVLMTRNYFLQYTQLEIPEFRDTLVQHMESVKKSIDKRALHKREYDSWVNERQMQTTKEKVDTSKELDASLVDIESNGTDSKEHVTNSRSGNDAHADDADMRPIYDEEPMAEVQTTAEINIFPTRQQHTEQPEFNNEGEIDQNAEQCHDTCPLPAKLTNNQITALSNQSLESENICLKKTVVQFQKDFSKLEAHCLNLELQLQNNVLKSEQQSQFLKEKSNEAKFKHDIDVIETINIELEHKVAKLLKENETLKRHYKELSDSIMTTRAKTIEHTTSLITQNAEFKAQLQERGFAIAALKNENQIVVRQPTAFKAERPRILKPRFVSQVDVNNDLSKSVTTNYLPKGKESACAKPHHMIALGSSRYSSNDMVHNYYLEEAKRKTQDSSRNSEPSVMPSARSQSTVNDTKLKPRINNQQSRNWPASKTSCVTIKTVPISEHPRNSRNFSDSKHFVCSTCQKCVFNANHDSCVTKFLNEVNSCANVPPNKTTNRNKPVEQISVAKKLKRQIPKGHRWVPTGKIFTSSTTKVDSEPTNGSVKDITNQYEYEQTLDVSAGDLIDSKCLILYEQNYGYDLIPNNILIHDDFEVIRWLGMIGDECIKGIMLTKIELTLEQSQQGIHSADGNPACANIKQALGRGSNTLSWKPCQGGSSKLNLPDHMYSIYTVKRSSRNRRYKRRCCSLILVEFDSLPHAHAQTTKTYYKNQDSRIKKAQELKTKTSANSDIQDLPLRCQVYQGRFTPIGETIDKIKRQIGEGKLRLLDNDGNPLVPVGSVESYSKVEVVFDETANLRISTCGKDGSDKGYGTNSLLEQ
nr:hypothetical protein [Tanacetum cinerariifolium]